MLMPVLISELDGGRGLWLALRVGARLQDCVGTLCGKQYSGDGDTVDDQATRAIIDRALDGDREAFGSLFRAYEQDVHRVCRRMLGDSRSAEDAVSEVFLRASRALGAFERDRPFRPWLIAIAGHYCIDQLRRRTSEARVFSANEPRESDLESPGPSPLGRLMAAEQRQALGRAIESLPVRYRLPLLLRYFDDMDYEAIAKSIGVTRNQVGTLLFRAKRLLRVELEAHASEPSMRPRRQSRATRTKGRTGTSGRKL
jgi:RNA polymerase sigma-70 factor (ECF subfamily)